jgi:hypothetical protein
MGESGTNANPFEFQNRLLENQQKEQEVQESQLKLAMGRFQTINSAASGLLSDPELGKTDIRAKLWDTLARATAGDATTAQHVVEFATKFPTDPNRQYQAIKAVHAQTLDALQRGQAYLGQTQSFSDPTGTHFFNVPSFGGTPTPQGFQPSGVAPGTPQYGPNNKQTFVGGAGNQPFEPQVNNLQPARPQQPQPNRLGVAPPQSLLPPAQPINSQRNPNGLGYQQPGSIVAAPPPGSIEAQKATGTQAGEELAKERTIAANYRGSVNSLEKAIPALEKLGTTGTGPGTEAINHLKSFVLSNIPGADFKGLKDDVATYDKAKKYLTDFVNQNGNSGTNDKLAASFAGNPSVNISNAAAVDVAKTALALRKMRQAQLEAFQESGLPDDQFGKWASIWNRQQDPRVYAWDYMNDSQKKTTLQSMTGAKRDHFIMAIHDVADKNFINPDSLKPSKAK